MRRLFITAFIYLVAGLASGVFYREFTKFNDFPEGGYTQLAVVHTHLLSLGVLVFLIVLALEKLFRLSQSRRLFEWFFWVYNAGMVLSCAMFVWHGCLTVLGKESGPMIAGIAGIGHIALSAGLILVFVALGRALRRDRAEAPAV